MERDIERDIEEVLALLENRWKALKEGCRGWARWIAAGGGRWAARNYLFGGPDGAGAEAWREIGPVPRAEERYRPQGLAYVDGDLWLTDHHENRRSHLYRLNPATGEVRMDVRMPDEARHPGGLAEDGEQLWALDYVSAKLYRIDRQATIDEQRAVVDRAYTTGLAAASALEIHEAAGRTWMAFSDFLWRNYTIPPVPDGTGRTFLVPIDEIDTLAERNVPEAASLAYDNGGYPQGLADLEGYLLEAVNHHRRDAIRVLDVDEALERDDAELVREVAVLPAPSSMVEDLATDGQRLWTSDESTYRVYVHPDPLGPAEPPVDGDA